MNTGLAILIVELLLGASIVHRLLWRLSVYWKEGSRPWNVDSNLSPGTVTIDVSEYGVWCDGIHDDTRSLQNIFRTIIPFKRIRRSDVHVIVIVPQECVVVSGPVTIQSISGLTLQIDGRLQAWDISRNNYSMLGVWPMQEPLITYGNSRDVYGLYYQYQPFIYMNNVSHVRITGNGVVDGFGQPWWDIITSRNESLLHLLSAGRPNLIQIINSSFIEIDTITIQNSPFWTLHPVLSQYIHIHHITISAPLYSPNVDGIDPEYVNMSQIGYCFWLEVYYTLLTFLRDCDL